MPKNKKTKVNNINNDIYTERLILSNTVSVEKGRWYTERFIEKLESDNEFEAYYGVKCCNEVKKGINLNRSLFFMIHLNCSEHKENKWIGYIGLTVDDYSEVCEIEFYIFKEYRRNGYATEAVTALTNELFSQKLSMEDDKGEVISLQKRKVIASITVDNTISRTLMGKCGFKENEDGSYVDLTSMFMNPNVSIGSLHCIDYMFTQEQWLKK